MFKILELDEFIEENDDSILLRDEYFCWDVVNNCLEIMVSVFVFFLIKFSINFHTINSELLTVPVANIHNLNCNYVKLVAN